jgi:hypothetical protein
MGCVNEGAALDVLTRILLLLQQAVKFKKALIKHECLTFIITVHQSRSIIAMIKSRG